MKKKMKFLLSIMIMLSLTQTVCAQFLLTTGQMLFINNWMACDVEVTWEVTDPAFGYCNGSALQFGAPPTSFIIGAAAVPGSPGGGGTPTSWNVNISSWCLGYATLPVTVDCAIGLWDYGYSGSGPYGNVCGGFGSPYFSGISNPSGTGPSAGACTGSWNMNMTSTAGSIIVDIW